VVARLVPARTSAAEASEAGEVRESRLRDLRVMDSQHCMDVLVEFDKRDRD